MNHTIRNVKNSKAKILRNDNCIKVNSMSFSDVNHDKQLLMSNEVLKQLQYQNKMLKYQFEKCCDDVKLSKVYYIII